MKKNPSMMGANQRGEDIVMKKKRRKKLLFLRAFARKMKARKSRLNPRTQLFLLQLSQYFPSSSHLLQTADHHPDSIESFLQDEPTSGKRYFPSSSRLKKDRKLNFYLSISI
ncbi:hypothetical protein CEXT_235141 [Caerostris extrusa]|uniref:Uncharacterized protein n=1 Tax=Caerostris extrusa TaxID=172846 RepID=A0AAV4VFF2_CAEEX|nr:hypothetical protein CEXT_235141 [Caerostris extrusa]